MIYSNLLRQDSVASDQNADSPGVPAIANEAVEPPVDAGDSERQPEPMSTSVAAEGSQARQSSAAPDPVKAPFTYGKPRGEPGRPGSGGYALEHKLIKEHRWTDEQYKSVLVRIFKSDIVHIAYPLRRPSLKSSVPTSATPDKAIINKKTRS